MFAKYKTVLVLLLLVSMYTEPVQSGTTYTMSVSWMFRGVTQMNNTVLTFNQLDTLNLVCRCYGEYYIKWSANIMLHKGSAPTNATVVYITQSSTKLEINDGGTYIYSDHDGIQAGFENIVVISDNANDYNEYAPYTFRYFNIGTLRTTDTGEYHCTAIYDDGGGVYGYDIATSGGITIQVNTKPGQAHSTKAKTSALLTYSALLLGASKALF